MDCTFAGFAFAALSGSSERSSASSATGYTLPCFLASLKSGSLFLAFSLWTGLLAFFSSRVDRTAEYR